MKTLSILIALILTLNVVTGAAAESKNNDGRKDFYKGWIELNSNCSC